MFAFTDDCSYLYYGARTTWDTRPGSESVREGLLATITEVAARRTHAVRVVRDVRDSAVGHVEARMTAFGVHPSAS